MDRRRSVRGIAGLAAGALAACAPAPPACERAPCLTTHVGDWRDRVIYQLVTDRFANGDPTNDGASGVSPVLGDLARVQGGDFRGITEHLDYLEALGVGAIWISPIVANVPRMETADGYHGYWASDPTELEPRFGTLEELQELVARAHARDLAVIVDVVPNHLGRVFGYDLDRDGTPDPGEDEPPYLASGYDAPLRFDVTPHLFSPELEGSARFALEARHFHRRGTGDLGVPEERRYGDFPDGLRDLATEDDEVLTGLVETALVWALRTDIDGFRIDAVPHVEPSFWPRFCSTLRRRLAAHGKRNFLLLGEVFERDVDGLTPWLGEDSVDSTFDFPMKFGVIDAVVTGGGPPSLARAALETDRARYRDVPQPGGVDLSPWEARVAFGDSHDLRRLRADVDDPFAVDQALVVVMTAGGIPLVYYGTEQDFAGGGGHAGREVLWETGFPTDTPTFTLLALLARLRDRYEALRRGETRVVYASEHGGAELEGAPPDAGLLVYERATARDRVLVALNTHPLASARAQLDTTFPAGTTLVDRLSGLAPARVSDDGSVTLELPPRTSAIFTP